MLSFKAGDQFTLVSKTDDHWWTVMTAGREKGLVPRTYLEPCAVSAYYRKYLWPMMEYLIKVRNGGSVKSATYITLYEYEKQDSSQLSFPKGQTVSECMY